MPILHYKLTSNNETIDLPSEIHSQSFMLRRIMVQQVPITPNPITVLKTQVEIRGPSAVSAPNTNLINFAPGSFPNVIIGMTIIGSGLAPNTTVTNIVRNVVTQITLSTAATGTILFTPNVYSFNAIGVNYMIMENSAGISTGAIVTGLNIPANTFVTQIDTPISYPGVAPNTSTTFLLLSNTTTGALSNAVNGYSFTSPPASTINGGGFVCQPSHLSGLEIISGNSSNSNDILVAYDETIASHNIYYDMEFDSESVPRGFQVKTFKFNYNQSLQIQGYDPLAKFVTPPSALNPTPYQNPGEIISIDLFFQFASLYNYESY